MRRYAPDEELRVVLQKAMRDWMKSGLLTSDQATGLDSDLKTTLRTTGLVLRLVLALFTVLALAAAVALCFVTFDIRDDVFIATVAGVFGVVCFVVADALVARFRLYRHGVEEALVVVSTALCGVSAAVLSHAIGGTTRDSLPVGLGACALVSAAAYVRFGFRYAAIGCMAFAAWIPLAVGALSVPGERLAAAFVCACTFGIATAMRRGASADVVKDDARALAAAALAGGYLALNLHAGSVVFFGFEGGDVAPWFKWSTYALTWVIPVFGLWRGVLERDCILIDVGITLGLVTLITNKPYLGWPRQTWDPMLFGLLLVGVALMVRRWLASGPGSERYGYTPLRTSHREGEVPSVPSSVATERRRVNSAHSAPRPRFFSFLGSEVASERGSDPYEALARNQIDAYKPPRTART